RRAAWTERGWYDDAAAWALHALMDAGFGIEGTLEQLRQWPLSSMWRIPTDRGGVLLKAVPPMFAHEGALMRLVADTTPGLAPEVIAFDRARGWTLMREVPGDVLRDSERPRHADAVLALARVQQSWIGREQELLDAGCHDRRLATMPAEAAALL